MSWAHALVFTGHMIDRADRKTPRLPAIAETRARAAIRAAIVAIAWEREGETLGLAAAANGGDLLFHEVCGELGIVTRVMLGVPVEEFLAESVAPAGADWVRRYRALLAKRGPDGVRAMGPGDGLLEGATDNVWARANCWMAEQAVAEAPERALLALWDGSVGDGPGGTEHFVRLAERQGIRFLPPIATQALLEG
jgi:hypothetical protein